MKKQLVIFASGNGSNAARLMEYFSADPTVRISGVYTNKEHAGVIEHAKNYRVPVTVFNRTELEQGVITQKLKRLDPDLIVLAGFLLKIPENLVRSFPDKIINIHPALLPAYGGKGMYGMNVHRAVVANRESKTGISIHYVNENYDEGSILFQQELLLKGTETPEEVALKVQKLEHQYLPVVTEQLLFPEDSDKQTERLG